MNRSDRFPRTILSVDVGGTRTRAMLASVRGDRAVPLWRVEAALAGKEALAAFLRSVAERVGGPPSRCAVDLAGPLSGRREARMTNWAGNPVIRLGDLEAWGLPRGRTLMLNDLEASACGILALEARGPARGEFLRIHAPKGRSRPGGGPRVVVSPGTGLGTASIIGGKPLPSEVQHAAAAPLDARHAAVVSRIARALGRHPSWEDLASGRGLEATYRALRSLDRAPADRRRPDAAAIAAAAGTDPRAGEALDYYYGCVGRAAQTLALAVLPGDGIYLCGTTTAGNAAFIRRSRFLRELHANAAQGPLLRRFPVFLVRADLNLEGGVWAAGRFELFGEPLP